MWAKVQEEQAELFEAIEIGDINKIEDELGDVFFSLINFARFLNVDAENALERTNKKFIHRFTGMEKMALLQNKQLQNITLQEMNELWETIKNNAKQH